MPQPPPKSQGRLPHEAREAAIHLAVEGLARNEPKHDIHAALERMLGERFGIARSMSCRTVETYIAMARARIRSEAARPIAELAAEQLATLREVQRRAMADGSAPALGIAVNAAKAIARLLGLNAPARLDINLEGVRQEQEVLLAALAELVPLEVLETIQQRLAAAKAPTKRKD